MSEKFIERVGLSLDLKNYKEREENKRKENKKDKAPNFETIFRPLVYNE